MTLEKRVRVITGGKGRGWNRGEVGKVTEIVADVLAHIAWKKGLEIW